MSLGLVFCFVFWIFRKGVRKQFLLTNGKTIYGFVRKGEKFANCSTFSEITDSVDCKVWLMFISDIELYIIIAVGARTKYCVAKRVNKSCWATQWQSIRGERVRVDWYKQGKWVDQLIVCICNGYWMTRYEQVARIVRTGSSLWFLEKRGRGSSFF